MSVKELGNSIDYARTSDVCQIIGKLSRRDEIPLVPQVTLQPFDKWVVDFMGPINPHGNRTGVRYIITAIDYLMRWAEASPVMDHTTATTMRFLFDNIVMWFGCPRILMSDQGSHFINHIVSALMQELQTQHKNSTPYDP